MQFVHQALTWGFFLVLVPLLIHLINMMRHRRVKWAAMDFLLQSYKRHRKWIWLKQLILLLMRMAAIALAVAMLAQWITRGQWLDIFGGRSTHHYVLLDDSYSMSDRAGGTNAFELGLAAVQRVGAGAAQAAQSSPQKFTLIRYSRAARAAAETSGDADADRVADFNAEIVDSNFDVTLEEKRNSFQLTELAVGPLPALSLLRELVDLAPDEKRLVHVVSDFRSGQWENPAEVREILREIEQSPAEVHLIGCVREARHNLSVIDVMPANETQAAGVPLFVNVKVKNFGTDPARNVQLKVRTEFFDTELQQSVAPDQLVGKREELPTVLIDEIEPGQTTIRRAQVFFPKPGRHVVQASLLDDPVAADNQRWCVMDFPEGEPVLIIDGSPEQRPAYFLQSAFQPGGRAITGVVPEVNTIAMLRDAPLEILQQYRAIYLLDVPRLDDKAIENLELYVRDGGGLGLFVGPEVNYSFYNNQLYKSGQGLLPLPLGGEDFLLAEDDENVPDIEPTDHPVFSVFLGERNPFIRLITVERYLRPQEDWAPAADSGVQVAAYLRNRMPLAVEKRFGEGRVMVFMTTLSPDWNNWGNDPSFVVMLLRLQSHLASPMRIVESRPVGSDLSVAVEAEAYRDDIIFVTPGETPEMRIAIERTAEKEESIKKASIGNNVFGGVGETDRSGIYDAWLATLEGQADVRRYALNVESAEGDLTMLAEKQLLDKLDPIKAEFRFADEQVYEMAQLGGNNRSLLLMCLLICLLLAEQAMAYSVSYHPARNGGRKS